MLWLRLSILYWIKVARMGTLVLFLILKEMPFVFHLENDAGVGLSHMAFIMVRYALSISILLRFFYYKWMLNLLNTFSAFIEMIYTFNSSICWCGISDGLSCLKILNHPCIPGINPTWSWCLILSIYCWICFANIFLKVFTSIFISDITL